MQQWNASEVEQEQVITDHARSTVIERPHSTSLHMHIRRQVLAYMEVVRPY